MSTMAALLLQWRTLGLMAVAMGREVSLLSKFNPREGLHKAEQLEVWLRFALFALVGDLARRHADGDNHSTHCAELHHLRQIAAALAVLSLLVAKMQRQMEQSLHGARRNARPALMGVLCQPMRAVPIPDLAYLDSS